MSLSHLVQLFDRIANLDYCKAEIGMCNLSAMSAKELEQLIQRLESVVVRVEASQARNNLESLPTAEVTAFVSAFNEILSGSLAEYLRLSAHIGSEVAEHACMVEAGFQLQKTFVQVASKSRKPSPDQMIILLKPQSDSIQEIQSFREAKRTSKFFNHLSAVSESIPALGWVAVAPTPGPYVKEMADAGQFYTNRVLMEYKDKDKTHVQWVKAWLAVLTDLQNYVKQYHTTGLSWNPKGLDSISASCVSKPEPLTTIGALSQPCPPPPPPPPLKESLYAKASLSSASSVGTALGSPEGDSRAALLASINQGSDITKNLKKVTADQMTHKNPSLRSSSMVPAKDDVINVKEKKPVISLKPSTVKPSRCELDGRKWMVEHQRDVPQLTLDNVQMNQVVYVYGCVNTVIIIKGKCNSISVDNCKKTSIVFDDIVSMVEFINCQSVKAQAMGKVQTVSVDKTDGAHIYFSPNCLDTEVVTSKSSEVNVSVPRGADGDYVECPIPEQFKSYWNGKKMTTEILDVAA